MFKLIIELPCNKRAAKMQKLAPILSLINPQNNLPKKFAIEKSIMPLIKTFVERLYCSPISFKLPIINKPAKVPKKIPKKSMLK